MLGWGIATPNPRAKGARCKLEPFLPTQKEANLHFIELFSVGADNFEKSTKEGLSHSGLVADHFADFLEILINGSPTFLGLTEDVLGEFSSSFVQAHALHQGLGHGNFFGGDPSVRLRHLCSAGKEVR